MKLSKNKQKYSFNNIGSAGCGGHAESIPLPGIILRACMANPLLSPTHTSASLQWLPRWGEDYRIKIHEMTLVKMPSLTISLPLYKSVGKVN